MIFCGGTSTILRSLQVGPEMEYPEVVLNAFRICNTLKHIDIICLHESATEYLRLFAPLTAGGIIRSLVLSKNEIDAFRVKHTIR
jgi:hypothetical protein